VNENKCAVNKAAKEHQLPRSIVNNHTRGKTKSFKRGRPPVFCEDEEKALVDLIINISEYGLRLDTKTLLLVVK
jgi:hypothetical protein